MTGKNVLITLHDIPDANYSIEVRIVMKKEFNTYLPERYLEVVRVRILNENLLEIMQVSSDFLPRISYYNISDMETFDIKIIGNTKEDDDIIEKTLKEDKE